MAERASLIFRVATQPWEFEQIHTLNYETFVEEIPQHPPNPQRRLVDKFHLENTYLVCLRATQVVGMIALRDQRPLSLDQKLDHLERYLPPFSTIVEFRLLAVKSGCRKGTIFGGLLKQAFELALTRGYDLAVISGTTRQTRLYQHLGFKPFGPLVGEPGAHYQPMYLDLESALTLKERSPLLRPPPHQDEAAPPLNYGPGPVTIAPAVAETGSTPPYSHRSPAFRAHFEALRQRLCRWLNGARLQIVTGSGTLANDIVAAQLSALPGRGLVLINGEFGQRLRDQAVRAGLAIEIIEAEEGETFQPETLEHVIRQGRGLSWLWAVHCETSTGVLNDLDMLRDLCLRHDLKLCLDAISSIGAVEVDLRDVYLATAVSGKGIGSLPGLALLFYQPEAATDAIRLPRYFDLAYYEARQGIPFTLSSSAIDALNAALERGDWSSHFANIRRWSARLHDALEAIGLSILARPSCRAPHVTTLPLPQTVSSLAVGEMLESEGYLVSYRSDYLVAKNRIQVCLMGQCQPPPKAMIQCLQQALSDGQHLPPSGEKEPIRRSLAETT